jgi:signal transduction histidine kinase
MAYSRVVDALYDIAAPDEKITTHSLQSKWNLLECSCNSIKKIIRLENCGIMLVNCDDFDFRLVYSDAQEDSALTSHIDKCIDDGTFSWALNQSRAVILHGENGEKSVLLHAISIRTKVLGMFVGVYDEASADFDEAMLALVSIILSKCAYQCEMTDLHAELLRQNETLEAQVEARTHELLLAKQKAEQATAAKAAFLAMMSHEIRTPLNGVLGMAQMLARSELNDEQRSRIEVILSSGQGLLTVINDVLDYSKMEAGKLDIVTEPVSIKNLLQEVVGLFEHKAEEKQLQLSCVVAAGADEYVYADLTRLKQILFNLVGNAIKFTQLGSIQVKVDSLERSEEQMHCIFRVTDTGIGIERQVIKELFAEFTQAEATTTRNYGGTGLGLAICRRLVEMMGGQIDVESKPGVGSTFWFSLPFRIATHAEVTAQQQARAVSQHGHHKLDLHVLLVEDNMVNQMVACAMLDDMGVQYAIAENGAIAAQMAVASHFDLILMDCQMPVMDGYTATQQIRQFTQGSNNATPIIALSAEAGEGFAGRCRAAGMNDVLNKPVEYNDLYNMLLKWKPQPINRQQA